MATMIPEVSSADDQSGAGDERHPNDVYSQDDLALPRGVLAGLSLDQRAHLARRAAEQARQMPRTLPPEWATEGPDEDGHWGRPTEHVVIDRFDGTAVTLDLVTSWHVDTGTSMWLDTTHEDTHSMPPAKARELAAMLLRGADALDPDGAITDLAELYAAPGDLAARLPEQRQAVQVEDSE